jgi:SAM-dependent methyltransferase
MTPQTDYILGTHDEEIDRLALQHSAWRIDALDAWRTAGFQPGDTILDVGCGPGFAARDLANSVGSVVAIDKSQRFLDVLNGAARANITSCCVDLDAGEFPEVHADGAWCRWVLSFTRDPRSVLARVAQALRPGGVIVLHEYFDYSTWRAAPRCRELETFVSAVMQSWRDAGGEPDIALPLPGWLAELGFELRAVRPIVSAVQPGDLKWAWVRAFVQVNRTRLVELGYLSATEAAAIWEAFRALEGGREIRMITPGVMEIVARRVRPSTTSACRASIC